MVTPVDAVESGLVRLERHYRTRLAQERIKLPMPTESDSLKDRIITILKMVEDEARSEPEWDSPIIPAYDQLLALVEEEYRRGLMEGFGQGYDADELKEGGK